MHAHHARTAHTQFVEVAAEDDVCNAVAMTWILAESVPKFLGVALDWEEAPGAIQRPTVHAPRANCAYSIR